MRILFLTQDENSGNLVLASAMICETSSRGWWEMGIRTSSCCSITPRTYAWGGGGGEGGVNIHTQHYIEILKARLGFSGSH